MGAQGRKSLSDGPSLGEDPPSPTDQIGLDIRFVRFLQTVISKHRFEHRLQFGQTLRGNRPDNLHIHSKVGVNDDVPKANHA
jgi:hypothetical protein